jgi:predicted lipid-binding transport protein (Tim44 family)
VVQKSIIFFERPTGLIGSRGSRRSAGVRFVPATAPEPPRTPDIAPVEPRVRRADSWMGTMLIFLGLRRAAHVPHSVRELAWPAPGDGPISQSSLDRGVREIHRTDPGFDPSRFAGYAGMIFRAAQHAWMTGDFESLRDRVTPEMYGEMQAQCDRLRSAGRVNHVAEVEITATVTEAWQEGDRDYVTADIGGSIVDYTETGGRLVEGSRTTPRAVEEFWTFTRPAGLNFWMLSAIQT